MERTIFIIGAVAWFSTALVHKDGPMCLIKKFREWTFKLFGGAEKSPLICAFCTGFWVLFPILILSHVTPVIVEFFGILGLAAAVRGLSAEYSS